MRKNRTHITVERLYGTGVSPSMMTIDIQPNEATTVEIPKVLSSADITGKGQRKSIANSHNPATRCVVSKISGRVYRQPQHKLVSYTVKDERI